MIHILELKLRHFEVIPYVCIGKPLACLHCMALPCNLAVLCGLSGQFRSRLSMGLLSLVPRPFEREEKGPGTYCTRMRQLATPRESALFLLPLKVKVYQAQINLPLSVPSLKHLWITKQAPSHPYWIASCDRKLKFCCYWETRAKELPNMSWCILRPVARPWAGWVITYVHCSGRSQDFQRGFPSS